MTFNLKEAMIGESGPNYPWRRKRLTQNSKEERVYHNPKGNFTHLMKRENLT